MHNVPETLGDVIKSARQRTGITMGALAEEVGASERYLYRIENENKKPSFDILFRLIHALDISPDSIFYPEKGSIDNELEYLTRSLYNCDARSMAIIKATIRAALESQKEK